MNARPIFLCLANFLTSLTGGVLLSSATTGDRMKPISFLDNNGPLAAMLAGSGIGFLITRKVAGKSFHFKAILPLLAVTIDVLTLVVLRQSVDKPQILAISVFGMFCIRWALWSTSRSLRAGVAQSLDLPVHYAEGSAFLGITLGAVIPIVVGVLWPERGWELEYVVYADISLFLIAFALDFAIADQAKNSPPATPRPLQYPLARILVLMVCLTFATQMVVMAYIGAIKSDIKHGNSEKVNAIFPELLKPAIYAGATLGCLMGGILGAILRLPGDPNSPVRQACLLRDKPVKLEVNWLCVVGAGCSLGSIWLPPRGSGPACLTALALAVNTILFTSSLQSIKEYCGSIRMARAMAAYLPMAISGYGIMTMITMSSLTTNRYFFTAVGAACLVVALGCAQTARITIPLVVNNEPAMIQSAEKVEEIA